MKTFLSWLLLLALAVNASAGAYDSLICTYTFTFVNQTASTFASPGAGGRCAPFSVGGNSYSANMNVAAHSSAVYSSQVVAKTGIYPSERYFIYGGVAGSEQQAGEYDIPLNYTGGNQYFNSHLNHDALMRDFRRVISKRNERPERN